MKGVNKVILIGNVGKDPEMRYAPSGSSVANFSVATTEQWKDKQGEKKESTEWHRCVCFGNLAEICGKYLKKGSKVYLEGKNKTRKWQGQDGQDRYTTEVHFNEMQMLGGSEPYSRQTQPPADNKTPSQEFQSNADFDDNIPF